jgi:hypothetical protein
LLAASGLSGTGGGMVGGAVSRSGWLFSNVLESEPSDGARIELVKLASKVSDKVPMTVGGNCWVRQRSTENLTRENLFLPDEFFWLG